MALPRGFSFQDASLLSGIEPLPLSSPASPRPSDLSSPPPLLSSPSLRRAVSSEVTAQLYASLRRSQEMNEGEENQHTPRRSEERGSTITSEVEDLADELSRRLQDGVQASERKEPSPYINQMESLRCHLKTMLTLGSSVTSHGEAPEKRLEQQSDTTSTLLSANPGQDLSPPLSLAGLEGLFPRYSTLYNAPLPDLQLRDSLEKETARRKHLERHIQNLQNEMLELQQRVSVMLAADRRKDSMIQQLDQTLAMVVGGWKQQENQREETMRRLREQMEEAQQARTRDQEALTQVEKQLAVALQSLDLEKKATKQHQVELQRQVDEQTVRATKLQAEREAEEKTREQERQELERLQRRMQEQQRSWEERERELQEECRQVQERGMREVEAEKMLSQQEAQKSQQLQLALTALQGDVLRLERELQTSHRERDTLQMELNLEKARNESEKVRFESEHKMRLEEVITERLSALHEESAQHLCTVREHHRKQLLDLTSQHEAELCSQISQFKAELQDRERRHRDIIMDYELKLSRSEERCQELSRSLRRLESERAEMLSQLQDVMKSHWSQALRVLSAKIPSESSSIVAPQDQMEASEQAPPQLMREGVYGEETSIHARQSTVGADDLRENSTQHLKDNPGTLKETDGHAQRSSQQNTSSSSQQLEDSHGSRQIGTRLLTDSSGSDLINFSRILDDRSQSLSVSNPSRETSLRFMGDGAQMSNKNVMANTTGGQGNSSDAQLSGSKSLLGSVHGTADATSLLNSGSIKSGDLQTLREILAGDAIRKYIADKTQDLIHQEMARSNIAGMDQKKDTSGHSVRRNETLVSREGIGHHIDELNQSLMVARQQVPYLERNILGYMDNSQYSFTNGPTQPLNLRNTTTVQIHHAKEDVERTTTGSSSLLREPVTYPSLDQSPITIPNLSPISKAPLRGHDREFSMSYAYQEDPVSHRHADHRVSNPEESFYPMQVEELSHSFSSHHGFFPLEPHPDATMTGTVSTTHPQTFPERPFNEEQSNQTQETSSHWDGGDQAAPNPVLQYYIRMLLDRTPGDPLNELDKGLLQMNPDTSVLSQSLRSRGGQPHPRSDEKEQDFSKFPTNPKKNPAKGPEAVKKEVLSSQRRPGPSKPLKRASGRGGRIGIWK